MWYAFTLPSNRFANPTHSDSDTGPEPQECAKDILSLFHIQDLDLQHSVLALQVTTKPHQLATTPNTIPLSDKSGHPRSGVGRLPLNPRSPSIQAKV